ncbi:MAG: aldo/keto reductase [Acidimicrobiia bacterium]
MIEYRPLGNTGLDVSELSIGGAAAGNEYGEIETARAVDAVRFAIDSGLNYVDTSPFYGDTLSERRLGEALRDGYRERVILATKAGRYGKSVEGAFDYGYDRILRSWEESSERLATDYIDLYQLHDVEFVPQEEIVDQAWPAMVRLRDEGKVGHIGITGYPVRHLAQLAGDLDPTPETILTYCHYDLLNTSFDDWLLPTVRELGIGVINASVTHMGVLTESGAAGWNPAPAAIHRVGREVCEYVRSRGARITDVALRFALAHPYIATTCVGMKSVDEVKQNLEVLAGALDGELLDRELLAGIREIVAPIKNLNWSQGVPEYNDPGSVPSRHEES